MPERPRDRYSFEQPPVRKIAAIMQVSAAMLEECPPIPFDFRPLTPEQVTERAAERERLSAARRLRMAAQLREHQDRIAATDEGTLRRDILELHQPVAREWSDGPSCDGCDPGEGSEDYPAWPCTTYCMVMGWTDGAWPQEVSAGG